MSGSEGKNGEKKWKGLYELILGLQDEPTRGLKCQKGWVWVSQLSTGALSTIQMLLIWAFKADVPKYLCSKEKTSSDC